MIGKTISHYKILEKLGEGGMGVVYKALDTTLDRQVAIKVLSPHMRTDAVARRRFVQEAKSASALDHPNICTIHEIDETEDGGTFIAMACYDGGTLRERIDRGPLGIGEAVDIAAQISAGLAKAHKNGIIHRDIKPSNIMFTSDGHVKIVDFGIAKLENATRITREGGTLGTAGYMSPEQARGDEVGASTDVWATGVILFEMLSGSRPFKGEYEPAIIYSIINDRPEVLSSLRGDIPVPLEDLVEKALDKDPGARFASAGELVKAFESVKTDPYAASRSRIMVGLKKFKRNRVAFFGTVASVIAAVLLITLIAFQMSASTIDSLAVLPVEYLSGKDGDVMFADGLTAEMISKLSRIDDWKVIGSSSVKRFRDSDMTPREIAKNLNVKALMIPTMQLLDNGRLRMTLELIRAETEEILWSDIIEKDIEDIERLQNEIVLSVASKLGIEMSPELEKRFRRGNPVDPEAYKLYLQGRYWFNSEAGGSLEKGIEYFNRALEIDSTIALAYAGTADCYTIMACHGLSRPHEVYPRARKAINKAMELDDCLAEVWTPLAHMTWEYDWDTETALSQIDRAVELNPSYGFAHFIKAGMLLSIEGKIDEAEKSIARAYELDPYSPRIAVDMILPMRARGEHEKALRHILELKDKFPEWNETADLAGVYAALGRIEEAISLIEEGDPGSTNEAWMIFSLASLYLQIGEKEKAETILVGLEKRYAESYYSPRLIANLHFALGNEDRALDWLEKAVEDRDPFFIKMNGGTPYLKLKSGGELKDLPRYQALLKRAGLD